jgi:hypothetical protein
MLLHWVCYDKEGRILSAAAVDESVAKSHPEPEGSARLEIDHMAFAKYEVAGLRKFYVGDVLVAPNTYEKQVRPKTEVKLAIGKGVIKADGADVATVTWSAPDPVRIYCNGLLPDKFVGELKVKTSVAQRYYRIEVDDPRYWSEAVWLRSQ